MFYVDQNYLRINHLHNLTEMFAIFLSVFMLNLFSILMLMVIFLDLENIQNKIPNLSILVIYL